MKHCVKIALLAYAACLVFSLDTLAQPSQAKERVELVTEDYEGADVVAPTKRFKRSAVKEIVVRDENMKIRKRISFKSGEHKENGRRIVYHVQKLDNQSGGVVWEMRGDASESNPYRVRASSANHIVWYRKDGTLLCDLRAKYSPKLLSGNGSHLVAYDMGFDPNIGMGKYSDRTKPAEHKAMNLADSFLYVLNDKCQVTYTTTSAKGGWSQVLISRDGGWVVLEESGSGIRQSSGEKKYFLKAIELGHSKEYVIEWDKSIELVEIRDNGILVGQKYVGEGKELYTVQTLPNGKEIKARSSIYRLFNWQPGDSLFKDTGKDVELKQKL